MPPGGPGGSRPHEQRFYDRGGEGKCAEGDEGAAEEDLLLSDAALEDAYGGASLRDPFFRIHIAAIHPYR